MKRYLDHTDEHILDELRANARISHSELSARVNLSRNAVRVRIERMERDGFIEGYTVVAGDGIRNKTTAIMFVYRNDRMRGRDVIQAVRKIREVVACDVMTGEFDLVLRVEAAQTDRIRQIWEQISELEGVRETMTTFVMSSVVRKTLSN